MKRRILRVPHSGLEKEAEEKLSRWAPTRRKSVGVLDREKKKEKRRGGHRFDQGKRK